MWNLQNPKTFHWANDLLPALKSQEFSFEAVDVNIWLERLHHYNDNTPIEEALQLNPAVKLIDFYEKTYGSGPKSQKEEDGKQRREAVRFDTTTAEKDSRCLREAADVLKSGLMAKTLEQWLKTWPFV